MLKVKNMVAKTLNGQIIESLTGANINQKN